MDDGMEWAQPEIGVGQIYPSHLCAFRLRPTDATRERAPPSRRLKRGRRAGAYVLFSAASTPARSSAPALADRFIDSSPRATQPATAAFASASFTAIAS